MWAALNAELSDAKKTRFNLLTPFPCAVLQKYPHVNRIDGLGGAECFQSIEPFKDAVLLVCSIDEKRLYGLRKAYT